MGRLALAERDRREGHAWVGVGVGAMRQLGQCDIGAMGQLGQLGQCGIEAIGQLGQWGNNTAPKANAQEAASPEAVAAVAAPAIRGESTPPKRRVSYSIV